jgi:glutaredoxin-like protein
MAFIDENLRTDVMNVMSRLGGEVSLILFTEKDDCAYCDETKELLGEIVALSDKLSLETRDIEVDSEVAEHFGVDKAPGLVVMGEEDHGIRFYGIPSGFEFGTLLEVIRLVSNDDPELDDAVREKLEKLDRPVHLQVFVTPTCPYCPASVVTAHKLAMASDKVTGDMVEATEFPELSQRHMVMSVPRTIVNNENGIDGAVPENHLIEWILSEATGDAA